MKPRRRRFRASKGFALLTVIMFLAIMAMLTASMLKYSGSERRLNERNRLLLRARNMAENVAIYASEQLTTKLYRLRSTAQMAFMTGTNAIYLPPDEVLTTAYSSPSDVEVRAGLTESTELGYVDPTKAENANDPNIGLSVSKSKVPIIAKATMHHPVLGSVTAYAEQDLQIAMIPLFQFAVFYNMDMEFGPGPTMVISGPVHTNGNLIARIQTGMTNTLQFKERVTAVGGFYADTAYKGKTYMGDGSVDAGPGGTGPLYFQNPAGTVTNIKSSSGTWRDHKYGNATETTTTRNQFKTFATSTFGANFRTGAHGVTSVELPSIGSYKETDDPLTPEDDTKNGRQIIEPPSSADSADLVQTKFGRRTGLYIVVNPDDETRTGSLPDGSSIQMRARSYRCFLNTVQNDGSHSVVEVILPGQPSYGALNAYVNNLPNAYRTDTSVGHNQVLRIPQGGGVDLTDTGYAGSSVPTFPTLTDSYFYDLRRGKGSNSYPFNRPSNAFVPRPIAKIDFDMTRFKMAVDRTLSGATASTVYDLKTPGSSNWSSFIYNDSADPSSHGLGLGDDYDVFPEAELVIQGTEQDGSGHISDYAGRFIIAESSDGGGSYTQTYKSTSNESSVHYLVSAGATHLRVRQYLGGATPNNSDNGTAYGNGSTRMLDEQIVPIIDGSAVTAFLSNDYHLVPSASSGSNIRVEEEGSGNPADCYTDMLVYVGGVDDTANWTFSATVTGGITGSLGTGSHANRFRLSSASPTKMTTDTATVEITATKGGTSISRTFLLEKQNTKTNIKSPANEGRWISSISYRAKPDPFRIYFAPADPNDARITSDPSAFQVSPTDLVSTTSPSPWFDGITIYVDSVDAEVKTTTGGVPDRVDSGVRLWNGRGPLISLSSATYPGRTGLSFASNDAVYIVGHFNADGDINSNAASTGTGGYSGRYPDSSSEMLCSVMGDAITILSQPVYVKSSSNYYQSTGWADSLSAHRRSSSGWSSSWSSTNPSSSNSVDGINTSVKPATMPNLSTGSGSGSSETTKLDPSETEVSTCLLTGIVHTTSAQTSGGVHNFPRLQENWNGTGLYIRGSMVAMFESQVATEPWSIRYYQGAGRYWGLHENLRAENGAHDLPLEPVVLNAQRMSYRELTPDKYEAMKATIEALPH